VGMGTIVSGAREVTESMFAAASQALAGLVADEAIADGWLYPPLADLRSISRTLAGAVARAGRDAGVGRDMTDDEIDTELERRTWDLGYPRLQPV